jgi:aminopeptidase YwaD
MEPAHQAKEYIHHLCSEITNRRVGSPGNQQAAAFFAETIAKFGFRVEKQPFSCIDWIGDSATLQVAGRSFEIFPSPYTQPGGFNAALAVAATLDELTAAETAGRILLLHGEIASTQLMPKNYPFYYPEEHQKIHQTLEANPPLAILTATARNQMNGGLYPCPMFEDGNFDIPSAYLSEEEGARLAALAGQHPAELEIRARRIPSIGWNVLAHKGPSQRRIVFTAHIDTKISTPGALDNASGIATLLMLAEKLQNYNSEIGIDILAFNGEEYFSAPGEVEYLRLEQERFGEILLNVNLDGLGWADGPSAFSLYECPDQLAGQIREIFSGRTMLVEGEQWYQGDHSVFIQNGVPALALTSARLMDFWLEILHTEKDKPALVNSDRLAESAEALARLASALGGAR